MKKIVALVSSMLMIVACSGAGGGDDLFKTDTSNTHPTPDAGEQKDSSSAPVEDASVAQVEQPDVYVPPTPGCVPETDKEFCGVKDCGVRVNFDNCGGSRAVACGPSTCGKSYACQDNKCTCVPKNCNDLGFTCGQATDGCGAALECGIVCLDGKACTLNHCECTAPAKHMCGLVPACVSNDDKACGPDCINCKPDLPGVAPACTNNECDYTHCSPGFTKCPNQPAGPGALGCQNLLTDSNNCGVCNVKCAALLTCVAGVCK